MKGSGSRFQVSVQGSVFGGGSGFGILDFGFRVPDVKFRIHNLGFGVSG